MELQHSQTWKNLQTAFSGELHACAKYKIYALRAREDGYEQMGNIFDETSRNEQEHAEIWLKHLSGGEGRPCKAARQFGIGEIAGQKFKIARAVFLPNDILIHQIAQ